MQTIVIGHRNPDMDSVCSAVAYAALKQAQGDTGAVAARAGELNARIAFVFEKFAVPPPMLLTDVTPQVRDVMTATPASVRLDAPIARAVSSIEERKLRAVPVVDDAGRCLGLLSAFKVLHHLFPPQPAVESSRIVRASLADIADTFDGDVVAGGCDGELRNYLLLVAAMKEESFSARLQLHVPGEVVVFAGDRDGIQRRAIARGVRAIVATGGLPFLPEIIESAAHAGVTLLRSRHDTATTVLQARGAVRVETMLDADCVSFAAETPLESARARAAELHVPAFPVVDAARRLVGILSKSDFIKPIPRQLVLVDHNELTQAVQGADKLNIVEVIDHHRIGGFRSDTPVHFWNNPVGSTSTIIALLYESAGLAIPGPIAGLLMAGLISDTLNLTSPTATPTDRAVLGRLEQAAGISARQLSAEIFSVGSPLQTLTPPDAVVVDCKEFEETGVRFSAAQIEEVGFATFHEKQAEIAQALDAYREARRLYFSALLITDINTQNSLLLISGPEEFRRQIDYPSAGDRLWKLDGVVSRKKQLLPYLSNRLEAARLAV